MDELQHFAAEHEQLTRRFFIRIGAGGAAVAGLWPAVGRAEPRAPELAQAIAKLEPYFTPPDKFQDVSRGKPLPHLLPDAKKREVGLTRDTWKLEVVSDPENPAKLGKQLTKADGTALDFAGLLKLGERSAVRFAKVMTCLNIGCPLGMGHWEGVPLRDVIWMTKPRENVRRVFYYGYHNDDPKQMFLSSLSLDRVLEDPFDLPPVILCYKLNGQWLDSRRGGPVRIVVPEAYGFKSIKWLTHVVLTNLSHANDTYASGNNDLDSPLKSFAATLNVPTDVAASSPIPVTGYAQVGISGVSKVQVWITPSASIWPKDDEYFAKAPWANAEILPPPERWGGGLPDDKIPQGTIGFDIEGRPRTWPLRLAKIHWATLMQGLPAGEYTLRCRTVDERGIAQPLPRPFQKSGFALIEKVTIRVHG
ncbi:MAG TPA: molybdopterin-dependent oxidoreductase [Pirellulales bacterium]|jgi:DMSO/TMAO reductase YedYZ molybdopterin-dependent catalytic subunit|nr:molybdopterin-dependent oxidoreductase [Pirellulales bacterium]